MGANAQTTVPLFVAGNVLTAAQQNISAGTGIPVFATTTTRDAAFGGSNKVLAEGQFAYLEDTNTTQYYDGAAWQSLVGGGAAIAFTPTFTGFTRGNGTTQSYYTQINKLVFVSCFETLGTTSAVTGSITMTLPVTASRISSIPTSRAYIEDNGILLYWATVLPAATTAVTLCTDLTNGTYANNGGTSATVPMTWGNLDKFQFAFVYEAA